MSIYATCISLDEDDEDPDMPVGAPVIYQGSHVRPRKKHARGGSVDLSTIPPYIEEPEKRWDWLRLGVSEDPSTYHGMNPGMADVLLTRKQVRVIRDFLTSWLERGTEW